jgi:hypothetical protein
MVKMKRSGQVADMADVSTAVQGPLTGANGHHAVNDGPQVAHAAVAQPTRDDVVRGRAYELYCERGCFDGFDVDDWCQAERELPSPAASVRSGLTEPFTSEAENGAALISLVPFTPVQRRS